MDDLKAECIFNEQAVYVKEEEDHIKEEPVWEEHAFLHGISAAAARAGLYANHEVKDELVLGPEGLQPPDIAFTLYACEASASRAQPVLRHGVARLERSAGLSADARRPDRQVADDADVGNQLHSNANVHTENESYVCDICNKRFALKTQLMEHVMIHIHQEPEQEEICVADNVARAPTARQHPALRDCVVRLERLAGRDERLASRVGRDTEIEKEIHGNIDISAEEETYICDTCEKRFPLKSQLVDHVMIHIQRQESRRGVAGYARGGRGEGREPAWAGRGEGREPVRGGRGEGREPARAGRGEGREPVRGGRGEGREPAWAGRGEGREPVRGGRGEGREPARAGRGEGREPVRGGRGEGREPARAGRGEGREPVRGGRGEGREPARGGRGEGREPARAGRGEGREPTRAQDWRHACRICHKNFPTPSKLKAHERIHTGERPFACVICKRKFTESGSLKRHERTHTGQRPFSCGICKQQFTELGNLKRHERSHTGEKPFPCGICKQKFTLLQHLKRHERTHTGQRPFACVICKRKFTESDGLKRHERTHTGQRPYACGICKWKFTESGSLKRHERTHTAEKPFASSTCKK